MFSKNYRDKYEFVRKLFKEFRKIPAEIRIDTTIMKERDKEIVLEFKRRLTDDIRVQIEKVIVFGSRAREEEAEDSDLDVIILAREKTPEIEKKLEDAAYRVMWDYDFKPIVSLKVFSKSQFNEAAARGFSFYKHIQKEGVSV